MAITDWIIYVDRHLGETCYFVGRESWQVSGMTYTYHVGGECYSKKEANDTLEWAKTLTEEQAEAKKHGTDTWGRFEMACERGAYGPEWGKGY